MAAVFVDAAGAIAAMGPRQWAYGAALAYTAATVAFLLTPRKVVKGGTPVAPANYQVVPAPAPPVTVKPPVLRAAEERVIQERSGRRVQ